MKLWGGELSRPSPDRLEVILNAFLENLDSICGTASQHPDTEGTRLQSQSLIVFWAKLLWWI